MQYDAYRNMVQRYFARIEWTLREMAILVRPHCAQIVAIFQPETYTTVWDELIALDQRWQKLRLQGHE